MRQTRSHIQLVAVAALAAVCLAGQVAGVSVATAASSPTIDKAALNKQVQEAIAKAKAEKGAGALGAGEGSTGAGEGTTGSSEAFSNLTSGKGSEEETTRTTPTTPTSSSSSISFNVLVPIFAAGALLLGGIAFFIVRDSRGMTPAGDGLASASAAQERAARQRKRRAKAKAARRQRKRNR
jgi:hypothetical protein